MTEVTNPVERKEEKGKISVMLAKGNNFRAL